MFKTFSEQTIEVVWRKGRIIPGYNPDLYRKDICGAVMKRNEYGNRNSDYGWEIDHVNPNGSDDLSNLRPLQWENNVEKTDSRDGNWTCAVTI
jgi:hypothetical protein